MCRVDRDRVALDAGDGRHHPTGRRRVHVAEVGAHGVGGRIRGSDGRVELYDMREDPGERRDLAGAPEFADAVFRLSAVLDRWVAAHPPVPTPETRESREDRARLRALGYLE